MAKPKPAPRFRRIIVLCNPASTHAQEARLRIARLEAWARTQQVPFQVVETAADGRAANMAIIRRLGPQLDEHTLLAVAAGDGTVNIVVEVLLTDPDLSENVRRTPVLPLWGGNANDLANMLNGPARKASLKRIIEQGRIVPLRPLACELVEPGKQARQRLAICYASFGASALAAHRLSHPDKRRHRLDNLPGGRVAKELITVIKAMIDAPRITVQENGRTQQLYEHIFLNGSRFAKVRGVRLQLHRPQFYHTAVHGKQLPTIAFHAWKLTAPGADKRVAGDRAAFTIQSPLWAQFDGEVVELAGGTRITVALHQRPLYVLSTLLEA